jgi:hypothetical protein
LGSSEQFICRFANGEFHWTYHDERGRLLVSGPPHAEQWEAHRRLLAAIQDETTSGALLMAAEEPHEEPSGDSDETPRSTPASGSLEPRLAATSPDLRTNENEPPQA